MALFGFKANNHPQQTATRGVQDDVDDRALPPEDFARLEERFGFTVDAAAAEHNAKCERYWSIEDDGLSQKWAGERVYCNPPFSNIAPWVNKAWAERGADLVVMLLPANRTEQKWWQECIEPYRDQPSSVLSVEFLPGRLRFLKKAEKHVVPNSRPPFGCVLCVWRWKHGPVGQGLFAER